MKMILAIRQRLEISVEGILNTAINSTIQYYGSLIIANNSAVNGYAIIHLATSQFK
jgi:hypothetical protein